MSAPWNDVQGKFEAALKAQAETVSLANRGQAAVSTGIGADSLVLPRIVVVVEEGPELMEESGVFECVAEVSVYSSARGSGAVAAHRSRCGYVFDAFMQDDLDALLSAAVDDFTCQGVFDREVLPAERDDEHWMSRLRFKGVVCGSDV